VVVVVVGTMGVLCGGGGGGWWWWCVTRREVGLRRKYVMLDVLRKHIVGIIGQMDAIAQKEGRRFGHVGTAEPLLVSFDDGGRIVGGPPGLLQRGDVRVAQ